MFLSSLKGTCNEIGNYNKAKWWLQVKSTSDILNFRHFQLKSQRLISQDIDAYCL
jgi:hypothetical protein